MPEWTGDVFVDGGLASILAYAGKSDPTALGDDDLQAVADWLMEAYFEVPAVQTILSVLFTTNFPAISPPSKPPDRRRKTLALLEAFRRPAELGEACTYCRRPAVQLAFRQHIPLAPAEEQINFGPEGRQGWPVCGVCLLSLLALPIGTYMRQGRILILHSEDREVMVKAAREAWLHNALSYQESRMIKDKRAAPQPDLYLTVFELITALLKSDWTPKGGVLVYSFSNSGQGPAIDVLELARALLEWVRAGQMAMRRPLWEALWQRGQGAPRKGDKWVHNQFATTVIGLPDTFPRLISRYMLPVVLAGQAHGMDVWAWLAPLMKEGIGMTASKIEAMRTLGEQLAECVDDLGDRRVYRELTQRRLSFSEARSLLIRADRRRLERGRPAFRLQDVTAAFDIDDDWMATDWRLTWDLITLATLEALDVRGWFARHPDEATEDTTLDDTEAEPDQFIQDVEEA
jgi:hypothetical protein